MTKGFLNQQDLRSAERLGLSAQALEALEACTSCGELETAMSMFRDSRANLKAAMDALTPVQALALLIRQIPETCLRYTQSNLPLSLLWDGMTDIRLWAGDYEEKNGKPGLAEGLWCARTLRLELFRLGRLQFEPWALGEEVRIEGHFFPAGTPCLRVHIPAGAPLDPDAATDSLHRANPFFQSFFGTAFPLFTCDSWLLSPQLTELLPPSSRILQFKSLFHIYSTDPKRQAEERVFGELLEDPSGYAEHTALQKAMKAYLCKGNAVVMGLGAYLPAENRIK